MDIIKLKTFVTLAREQSFSRTADELYCSQAAVSKQIAALENYYGMKLFERGARKATLNKNGEILLKYANNMLSMHESCKKELIEQNSLLKGTIRIEATSFISKYVFPQLIDSIHDETFETNIELSTKYFSVILEDVRKSLLDFGFISQHRRTHVFEGLLLTPFDTDELVIIMSCDNSLSQKQHVTTKDICDQTVLISSGPNPATYSFFKDALLTTGASLPPTRKFGNTESIKHGVARNYGISVVSRKSIANLEEGGPILSTSVEGLDLTRKLFCVKKEGSNLSASAVHFLSKFIDSPECESSWQNNYG